MDTKVIYACIVSKGDLEVLCKPKQLLSELSSCSKASLVMEATRIPSKMSVQNKVD